ncbi:pentapeptide repeat-containing protein [Actinomadura sp. 21ATH]|uniref:pentapeptide repeat-containing protein n=1 Tax=Actinomadura sp. 21ATH TaxID=1735444 RepID=UPI0035C1EFFF
MVGLTGPGRHVHLGRCRFEGDCSFDGAVFGGVVSFFGARFGGNVSFRGGALQRQRLVP